MDPDSYKNETKHKTKISDFIPHVGNVFLATWLRRDPIHADKINRFFIWCEFGIILPCGIFLWALLYFFG
jgi:hypothetical protein